MFSHHLLPAGRPFSTFFRGSHVGGFSCFAFRLLFVFLIFGRNQIQLFKGNDPETPFLIRRSPGGSADCIGILPGSSITSVSGSGIFFFFNKRSGIKHKLKVSLPVLCLRSKGFFCCNFSSVRFKRLSVILAHQAAAKSVCLSWKKVLPADMIPDRQFFSHCKCPGLPVARGCKSADRRIMNALVFVFGILVNRNRLVSFRIIGIFGGLSALQIQLLKSHCSPSFQQRRVISKGQIHNLHFRFRLEGGVGSDFGSLRIFKGTSCRLVHKDAGHKIIISGDQSSAGDVVNCDRSVRCKADPGSGQLVLCLCLHRYQADNLCLIVEVRV